MLNETNSPCHADSGMLNGKVKEARIQELLPRKFTVDPWRIVAISAGFPINSLRTAEVEILDLIDRVVIQGKGWGLKDELRGLYEDIPLSPAKLSWHGNKKSPRTYQRSIRRLDQLGLIINRGIGSDQLRSYSPAWWTSDFNDHARQVWQQAAAIFNSPGSSGYICRTAVAPVTPLCRSHVAPPVPNDNHSAPLTTVACDEDGATSARTDTADGNRSN